MLRFLGLCILALVIITGIILFHNKRSSVQSEITNEQKIQRSTETALANDRITSPKANSIVKGSITFSNFVSDSRVEKILAKSSPDARADFERALEVLRSGDALEAFSAFHSITWKYRDDSVKPLAEWGLALSYHHAGGPGYALFAAEHFDQYCKKHAGSEELEFLVQAADINKAVIQRELTEFDPAELLGPKGEIKNELQRDNFQRSDPITIAQKEVELFLSEWPKSPFQNTAKQLLAKIQEFAKQK